MITDRPKRLTGVGYVGMQRYSVTFCTAFRKPIFDNFGIGAEVASQILRVAADFQFDLTAYCLMPDHVHILAAASCEASDLPAFVKHAKQITGYTYRRSTSQPLWQRGYYDRILRDDEASLTVAKYILENPIRAGLAKALGEWPLAGSSVYSWTELLTAWEEQTRTGSIARAWRE
jgi:REP element-mobilizing transposase RayT